MTPSSSRKQWLEFVSVAVVVGAAVFLFYEILRTHLPIGVQSTLFRWLVIAAVGASLLCVGVGVISVTSYRLVLTLRRGDTFALQRSAKDHLAATGMVVAGFLLLVCAFLVLMAR